MDALNVRKKKEGRDDIGGCWNWMGTKGGWGGGGNRSDEESVKVLMCSQN